MPLHAVLGCRPVLDKIGIQLHPLPTSRRSRNSSILMFSATGERVVVVVVYVVVVSGGARSP
jgi:hypothetical protein